jgi:hypothetical protein
MSKIGKPERETHNRQDANPQITQITQTKTSGSRQYASHPHPSPLPDEPVDGTN